MWCCICQLDTPQVALSDEPGEVVCANCGEPQDGAAETQPQEAEPAAESHAEECESTPPGPEQTSCPEPDDEPPASQEEIDDWIWDLPPAAPSRTAAAAVSRRIDQAHRSPANAEKVKHAPVAPAQGPGLLLWAVMGIGVMGSVCGAVLWGWAFVDGRPELIDLGMPLSAAGQAVLIVGLVVQCETLWRRHNETRQALRQLEQEQRESEMRSRRLDARGGPAEHSLHRHVAEGGSPHLLLADLQGQIDLLADTLAER